MGENAQAAFFVPPDGGWGWIVAGACALSNIVVIPIIQNFGFIFQSRFDVLNISGTDISILITINSAFGMLMGLVNGSLLKRYKSRKISFLGGLLVTSGVIWTAYAESFSELMIAYGLLTSLGFGMTMSAMSLAVNTYFKEKRGYAIGITTTLTGLGPVFMPILISCLLGEFGVQGTMLIIGAISMHTFVAAALVQPVKWHMKLKLPADLGKPLITDIVHSSAKGINKGSTSAFGSTFSINFDGETMSLYETPAPRKKFSVASISERDRTRLRLTSRSISVQETEEFSDKVSSYSSKLNIKEEKDESEIKIDEENNDTNNETKQSLLKEWAKSFLSFLDVDLLKDVKYLSLMIGMSVAICAEMNFSLLTPIILYDFGYSTDEIAQTLSCIAFADIIFRFISPFIHKLMKLSVKVMYTLSLMLLIITRTALIFSTNFTNLMVIGVGMGIAKGFRTVFMSLLIPSYVPLEKLANASGIQMMANGIVILIGGPIVGFIRDKTGNYIGSIIVMNAITFTTILIWTLEYIYYGFIKRNR